MKKLIAKLKEWHALHSWSPWEFQKTISIWGDGWGNMTAYPTRFESIWRRQCEVCKKPERKVIKT